MRINMGVLDKLRRFRIAGVYSRDGACAVAVLGGDDKRREYEARISRIAELTEPCARSCDEIAEFLRVNCDAKRCEISPSELNMFKTNFLLGFCPERLSEEEFIPKNPLKPSRRELALMNEKSRKRFEEALAFPIEELDLDVVCMRFMHPTASGAKVRFTFIMEKKSGFGGLRFSAINLDEAERTELCELCDTITVFGGVSREDIDRRTPRFLTYAAACERLKKAE